MTTRTALPSPRRVQGTYYTLMLGNTLAASFIWGINTLFLLDAGLSNLEAFAANAFFTAGMLIFEIPTGVVADTVGRRASYLIGTVTLAGTTALYWMLWVWESPFWAWAIVSVLLGLGFTFFSGAVDAWLVDALTATGYRGSLEAVFGRAQIVGGIAMLSGSVLGGVIAQFTNLGVPFLVRACVLVIMFVVAALLMHDIGFTPERGENPLQATRTVFRASVKYGLGNPPVRKPCWMRADCNARCRCCGRARRSRSWRRAGCCGCSRPIPARSGMCARSVRRAGTNCWRARAKPASSAF